MCWAQYGESAECGEDRQNYLGNPGDENLPNQPLKNVASSCVCDDKCSDI